MTKSSLRRWLPTGQLIPGVVGWAAYIYWQHTALAIVAGCLTLLAVPRVVRGPRHLMERRIMKKLRSAKRPSPRLEAKMISSEEFLMELHEHSIVLLWWWMGAAAWSALSIGVYLGLDKMISADTYWAWLAPTIFWGVGLTALCCRLILWKVDRICVTDKRIFAVEGFFTTRVSMIPLKSITDKDMVAPWHSRVLTAFRLIESEYGSIRLETAGEDTKLSNHVFLPNVVEISKVILPYAMPDE